MKIQIMSKPLKESIKFSFLNIDLRVPIQRLPINWLNFKNYYTKHGKYPSNIIWMEPILNFEGWSFDDIVNYYDEQDSDIYAFSSYLWSHMAIMAIAEELKKRNSKRIVVLGGPHLNITHNKIDWFFKHKFVDAICEPTSYGEWFITDLLNQFVEGDVDWKEVSFSVYRTGRGKSPSKIDFKFPGPLIPGNEDILFKCKDISMERSIPLVLPIELTRGCPYECVFCEWGGGIGGKVVRKNMEDIKADLDYIPQVGIEQIQILDANYGIYKEDEDVSKYIEDLKITFGLPNHVEIYGMTKSKQERRWATIEPLARAKVVERYKLSLQTLNNEVLRNIKRTDIPREKDFEFANYLFETYGVRSDFEFMMGLPGYTRQDFYDEVDIQYEHGYNLERYLWLFLPDSPAYDPEYIKKFNIKTEKTCIGKSRMNSYAFDDISVFGDYHISADLKFLSDVEFVVEADGYTRKDFTEFFFMNYWILNNVELFDFADKIVKYNIENGVIDRPSLIFQKVYENILNLEDNEYAIAMKDLNDQMYDFICGKREEIVDYKEFNLPHTNVSVDFNYIHKACIFAFQKDYVEFMLRVVDQLGLIIPDNSVELFESNLDRFRQTPSPKFDRFYQIRTFYENFINEKYSQTV
jgi:radical SAM superfamily enzyme YgiQ (UPF0313 family)